MALTIYKNSNTVALNVRQLCDYQPTQEENSKPLVKQEIWSSIQYFSISSVPTSFYSLHHMKRFLRILKITGIFCAFEKSFSHYFR